MAFASRKSPVPSPAGAGGNFAPIAEFGNIRETEQATIPVRVVRVKGTPRVDIREFVSLATYTGPTKKGVCLTLDEWRGLLAMAPKVTSALMAASEKKPAAKAAGRK